MFELQQKTIEDLMRDRYGHEPHGMEMGAVAAIANLRARVAELESGNFELGARFANALARVAELEATVRLLIPAAGFPLEPATTSDGCYNDDPIERHVRAVLSAEAVPK